MTSTQQDQVLQNIQDLTLLITNEYLTHRTYAPSLTTTEQADKIAHIDSLMLSLLFLRMNLSTTVVSD